MKNIKVQTDNPYTIHIGIKNPKDIVKKILSHKLSPNCLIITDDNVAKYYLKDLLKELKSAQIKTDSFIFPAGEKSKSLKTAEQLYNFMNEKNMDRKSFIIALGGGITGDLSGFVAATYKRGIPFFQIPTTLLSQVDSSVGGKTGVNIKNGKNFVGAFYQPKAVFINTETLKTLPEKEIGNGLAEIIKYALIADKKLFSYLEKNIEKAFACDEKFLNKVIAISCAIKADVVSNDEKENGLREILNFGHTVGHAIEEMHGYKNITHGEGVALGMITALLLSEKLGLAEDAVNKSIELIKKARLPYQIKKTWPQKVTSLLKHDKKVQGGKNRFVLISEIGKSTFGNITPSSSVKAVLNKQLKLQNTRF